MPLVNKENNRSVLNFIKSIENKSIKEDSETLLNLINELSGFEAKMWGNEMNPDFIIGFGKYTYQQKGKKEILEWFHLGFAPRKQKITLYLSCDLNKHTDLLEKLGKCKWGKGCLHINKLKDIEMNILKELIIENKDCRWH